MQDAQLAPDDVLKAPPPGQQRAEAGATQAERERVDTEVTALKVFADRGRRHDGKRPGVRIALAARGSEVIAQSPRPTDRRGAKASVREHLAAQAGRERTDVADDDEVEIQGSSAEPEVAHRAADKVDLLPGPADRVQRPRAGGQRAQSLGKLAHRHDGHRVIIAKRAAGTAVSIGAMRFLPRRRLWRALLSLLVVAVGVGVAAAVILLNKPGDVSHPEVAFTAPRKAATTKPVSAPSKDKTKAKAFSWPWYGYSAARTRDFIAPANLAPPMHVGWSYHTGALLEFPPSIEGDHLYFLDDSGFAREIDSLTGKVLWTRKVGTLAAASPAIDARAGLLFMPILSDRSHTPGDGRFVALSMKTGRVKWSRPLPAGSESSPIVSGDSVYFGDGGGTLYAWTFPTVTPSGRSRPAARSRAVRRCGTGACTSATTPGGPTPCGPPTASRCGRCRPRARTTA